MTFLLKGENEMITRKEYDQAVLEIPQDVKVLEWNGTLGTFSFIAELLDKE